MHALLVIYGVLGLLTAIVVQIGSKVEVEKGTLNEMPAPFLIILTLLVSFALWPFIWLFVGIGVYQQYKKEKK